MTTLKKMTDHTRRCAQCASTQDVKELCREGKVLVENLSFEGMRSIQESDAALLVDALAYVKANEWAGRMEVNDEMVPCCLDCGAQKGQAHSVNCGCLSLLLRGGKVG